jgi:hypothetical protein
MSTKTDAEAGGAGGEDFFFFSEREGPYLLYQHKSSKTDAKGTVGDEEYFFKIFFFSEREGLLEHECTKLKWNAIN